jgi:hypothetical protein
MFQLTIVDVVNSFAPFLVYASHDAQNFLFHQNSLDWRACEIVTLKILEICRETFFTLGEADGAEDADENCADFHCL